NPTPYFCNSMQGDTYARARVHVAEMVGQVGQVGHRVDVAASFAVQPLPAQVGQVVPIHPASSAEQSGEYQIHPRLPAAVCPSRLLPPARRSMPPTRRGPPFFRSALPPDRLSSSTCSPVV